ncbi:ABC transporter ATP-binding protein [Aestuariivirga sp.]|uniref:ABC transporter ATP-binding protein n=1 Tax=Aestuariivirga sp. TaxID=2650926 RepID=UPI0025BC6B3C|nr:ABC transporter ATP-binding protein [Aestuariivirga sp.]MCA3556365.1 ABC transporter ATP-binding protein [Aestuariivirga sp.]
MRSDKAAPKDPPESRRWGTRGTAGATFAGQLTFEHVSRRFGRTAAVEDVSFTLKTGEIACLLGPSGCGKTTLLRIAAGIDKPDSGRLLFDGQEMAGPSRFVPPEKRNIGLMFQDFALFPHLPIIGNVAFGLNALPRKEAYRIALHALERVGLAHYAQSYPHSLSGGEQQRVALARALVPRPQVLLMDEPFSGLDQRLRESVRAETLTLLRETRASCLLVTHDPVEAMGLADRILLMRRGRLIQTGTPEELYRAPVDAAAARFFSDTDEIRGLVDHGNVMTALGAFPCPDRVKGPQALVLIRPQGIRRAEGGQGVEGLITDTRFQGDDVKCSVLFKGLEEPLNALLESRAAPQRGETGLFRIDPDHVFVFESDSPHPI